MYSNLWGRTGRYGSDLTRAAIAETVLRPQPISFCPAEVGEKVTEIPNGPLVVARIPFRLDQISVPIEGRVIAYTDAACKVEFTAHRGETHQLWVWRGAVRVEKSHEH